MNGAAAIARTLREAGVEVAFGLPGAHNLPLWSAFAAEPIRIVGMRHEQGCAYAADGYARTTGKLGVALVTTGPGAANTIGAIGEAWASRSPVIVIATDIPTTLRTPDVYRGVLHECTNQPALFGPVTKVQTESIASAVRTALEHPRRPVYVGVPTDVLAADAYPESLDASWVAGTADMTPLLDAIDQSSRPLLWVGGGARHASEAIDALARATGAPVVTTYQARGILAPDHPLLVPAPPHEPEVTELIRRADLAIVIGSDLDQMNTMQWRLPLPERRVAVNLDHADATKNYTMDAVVVSDARGLDLAAEIVSPREPWAGALPALGKAIRTRVDPDAAAFLEHTETALPSDAITFADMCVPGYWLAGHMRVETERGLHFPMGWGTLGFALPAAIGASVAAPTVAFVGDGGALFALGELSALAELQTPCTIVVVDDGGYGMLRHGPTAQNSGVGDANDLPPVDFVQVAAGFGIEATRVDGFGADYARALALAVESAEPRVLHVRALLPPPATTTPFWPIKE
jgi:thiamine pyrophosphate-dependent acetolactate synthase large subunit-like protein